jgi:glutamyl-tRNA synthetase
MIPDKIQKFNQVRVRIAPSPTGFLHVGTARAALFNYLFAKKNKGSFILRIEDTDIERSKPEFEQNILDGLKWLGMDWDEGPDKKGECGFYRQSERLDIYSKYLQKLLDNNQAYYCFCSKEELEAQRQYQMSIGQPPHYDGKCSNLSKDQIEENIKQGKESVIRFRVQPKKVKFNDLVRGTIEIDTSLMGDVVIAKDLRTPLYNFAVVIDDYEMKISHVIRGEDHISNTPKQILLYEALNIPQPQFAHLPLILGTDRSKLSKRHGATSIGQYKKDGYLPEAMVNFMIFLGWNPGTDKEIYSLSSLVKDFSIEKVQKAGAIFNIKKLDFLNSFYIRQKSPEKLTELCLPYLIEAGLIEKVGNNPHKPDLATLKLFKNGESPDFKIKETGEIISFDTLKNIILAYQERLIKLSDIVELTDFFFKDKITYSKDLLRWKEATDQQLKSSIDKLIELLSEIKDEDWNKKYLEEKLAPIAEEFGQELTGVGNRGYLLWPLRVAMTGKKASAGPFDLSEILGKEKTLKRLKEAKQLL